MINVKKIQQNACKSETLGRKIRKMKNSRRNDIYPEFDLLYRMYGPSATKAEWIKKKDKKIQWKTAKTIHLKNLNSLEDVVLDETIRDYWVSFTPFKCQVRM